MDERCDIRNLILPTTATLAREWDDGLGHVDVVNQAVPGMDTVRSGTGVQRSFVIRLRGEFVARAVTHDSRGENGVAACVFESRG